MLDPVKLFSSLKQIQAIDYRSHAASLISGGSLNHNVLFAAKHFRENGDTIFYVARNLYSASGVYELFCDLIGKENVNFYVTDEIVSIEALAVSNEFRLERLHTLRSLIRGEKKLVVTCIQAFLRPVLKKEIYQKSILYFREKDTVDVAAVIRKLVVAGYKRTPITFKTGDFSVRGEVLDIFPLNLLEPVRIDLYGDEIEYIKTFDVKTQRTEKRLSEVSCFPVHELIYDDSEKVIAELKKDIADPSLFEDDFLSFRNYDNNEKLYKYIGYVSSDLTLISEFVAKGFIFIDDYLRIKENYEKTQTELNYFLKEKKEYKNLRLLFFRDLSLLQEIALPKLYLMEYRQSLHGVKLDALYAISGTVKANYRGNVKYFIDYAASLHKTVVIMTTKDFTYNLLKEEASKKKIILHDIKTIKGILPGKINICKARFALSFGFTDGIEVICDDDIFPKVDFRQSKYRSSYRNIVAVEKKEDLEIGDYVVHYDYGIARYQGLKAITLQGITNDYLSLQFADTELLVPIERINYIEKYLAAEGHVPKLSYVGTNEWKKKKKKIQEKVEDLAASLIKLEAIRSKIKGFKYPEDDELQNDFESQFEYQLTPDQEKAVADIKQDMEKGTVIDRLVCGDVGYGKTEVALRAAFKAIAAGKQVACIAPTTILARQHFYRFQERLSPYGIKVAMLSRLVRPKEQAAIVEGLKQNRVNIVVGTHALLSKRVGFFDLGLLIIDEEQRFGVVHKEKIKNLKNNVDVITLTATPIPRTLQMSIMGLRQFSLIETPPMNRYPVQTYVLEYNDIIVREAIYREIGRKGQVFYLHNRVENLENIYLKLSRLVPEAKIVIAHGQMPKIDLENSVQAFVDGEYNVLLCTTIIENGIDIPNANTLIVDHSDLLGLAQMYQIRGRVGRTNKISYAYFMFNKGQVLTDATSKRLKAIQEFTKLGSGYKIAMRDLAIRGAGEILGKRQSGFIDAVGIELYMKMLAEAIKKLKGIPLDANSDLTSNIKIAKHVSDSYIEESDIKIYIHQRIKNINSLKEKNALKNELEDRFGTLTDEIIVYMNKQYMDSLLKKAGVLKIADMDSYFEITFKENADADFALLFKEALKVNRDFFFKYTNHHVIMRLKTMGERKEKIGEIIKVMENYFAARPVAAAGA